MYDFFNSKKKKVFLKDVENSFGCSFDKDNIFFINNKGKVYMLSKDFSFLKTELFRLDAMGLYIGRYNQGIYKPSIEGSQLLGPKATKNVIELTREQRNEWLLGHDVPVSAEENIYILKYEDDYLGSGKVKEGYVLINIPKARRLKVVND